MYKTKLQVPISVQVKEKSEKRAQKMGFSSLNEFLRVLLSGFSEGTFTFNMQPTVFLDEETEESLGRAIEDVKNGRVVKAKT